MQLVGLYDTPFSTERPKPIAYKWGDRISEIVAKCPALPPDFRERGVVSIGPDIIEPKDWDKIRITPRHGVKVVITCHVVMQGGGRGGGKNILLAVASIALALATAFIGAGGLVGVLGSSFGAGTFGASALALGVGIVGSLALRALSKPPALPQTPEVEREENLLAASVEGNVLAKDTSIPAVIGTRKIYPSAIAYPFVELVGQDEYAYGLFALGGPHSMTDIRVGTGDIDQSEDIEYETREGWTTDAPLDLIQRQAFTESPQTTLSTHIVKDENKVQLEAGTPADKLPKWHAFLTRVDPDEVWMHLLMPQGLTTGAATTTQNTVPFRIRIREAGEVTWVNLPEMHFTHAGIAQVRAQVKLKWEAPPDVPVQNPPTTDGWHYVVGSVPAQTANPVGSTTQWDANSYFTNTGDGYLYFGNAGGSGIYGVAVDGQTVTVYLDPATFDKGQYEIEVKRGAFYTTSAMVESAYTISGSVYDLFGYYISSGNNTIIQTRADVADTVIANRIISVWNENPVPLGGRLALIAVKAKNRQVDKLSCVASRYVQDWDGSAWDNWTTTSNPAPHYRSLLAGPINRRPIPEDLIDDTALTAWRTACTTNSYTCDMIMQGGAIDNYLDIIASCGYALRAQSELHTVIREYDRSSDDPVQVFTPANSRDFKFKKAFEDYPDGLRVGYRPSGSDYQIEQITVARDGEVVGPNGYTEQVTYEGFSTEAKVTARAQFDIKQAELRDVEYSLTVPPEILRCKRGSLIEVVHDSITNYTAWGRIVDITRSGASPDTITNIYLDREVELENNDTMQSITSMQGVTSMQKVGIVTKMGIRKNDGTFEVYSLTITTTPTNNLVPATPITDETMAGAAYDDATIGKIDLDCLVYLGPTDTAGARMIVKEIIPQGDMTAQIVAYDEAPGLWS